MHITKYTPAGTKQGKSSDSENSPNRRMPKGRWMRLSAHLACFAAPPTGHKIPAGKRMPSSLNVRSTPPHCR
jgi:hypothetical protein